MARRLISWLCTERGPGCEPRITVLKTQVALRVRVGVGVRFGIGVRVRVGFRVGVGVKVRFRVGCWG